MESQQHVTDMGGTMRLGAYPCRLGEGTRAAEIYGTPQVSERHRHRYEVSNSYRDAFVEQGLTLSGLSPDGSLVEIVELQTHPWFIGCQFHPELQSRPTRPHPLFASFIGAAAEAKKARTERSGRRWKQRSRVDRYFRRTGFFSLPVRASSKTMRSNARCQRSWRAFRTAYRAASSSRRASTRRTDRNAGAARGPGISSRSGCTAIGSSMRVECE